MLCFKITTCKSFALYITVTTFSWDLKCRKKSIYKSFPLFLDYFSYNTALSTTSSQHFLSCNPRSSATTSLFYIYQFSIYKSLAVSGCPIGSSAHMQEHKGRTNENSEG